MVNRFFWLNKWNGRVIFFFILFLKKKIFNGQKIWSEQKEIYGKISGISDFV